ncbi:hypothetical protein KVV02_001009 [Mortierella alpina]|uniref:Methyltransferase type 11 domain-containing protein n=1 Tax=Mortierella alpina TaxID=64518 RepID=A0A9P8CWG0_MORAP|nr:hypothetical protein KVV02_001009 [Mortierella alpina]
MENPCPKSWHAMSTTWQRVQVFKLATVFSSGRGVGGPPRQIAHFGAHITGLNINDYQISGARRYTIVYGLQSKQDFVKGDFMNILLESSTFDACYAIEAAPLHRL